MNTDRFSFFQLNTYSTCEQCKKKFEFVGFYFNRKKITDITDIVDEGL